MSKKLEEALETQLEQAREIRKLERYLRLLYSDYKSTMKIFKDIWYTMQRAYEACEATFNNVLSILGVSEEEEK